MRLSEYFDSNITRGGTNMNSITLRMNDRENSLVRNYAKANNMSISELVRQSVLEKIEDEIDLNIYKLTIQEHKKQAEDISFDDMISGLRFNE